jgi:hypothetical protein
VAIQETPVRERGSGVGPNGGIVGRMGSTVYFMCLTPSCLKLGNQTINASSKCGVNLPLLLEGRTPLTSVDPSLPKYFAIRATGIPRIERPRCAATIRARDAARCCPAFMPCSRKPRASATKAATFASVRSSPADRELDPDANESRRTQISTRRDCAATRSRSRRSQRPISWASGGRGGSRHGRPR